MKYIFLFICITSISYSLDFKLIHTANNKNIGSISAYNNNNGIFITQKYDSQWVYISNKYHYYYGLFKSMNKGANWRFSNDGKILNYLDLGEFANIFYADSKIYMLPAFAKDENGFGFLSIDEGFNEVKYLSFVHGVLWGDYDVNPCCRGLKSKIIIRENEIIQGYYHPSLEASFIYLGYKKGEKWDYLDFNNNNTQLYDFEAINDSLFVSCKNKIRKYYLTEPQPYVYHEPRIITINLDLDLYYLKYLNDTLYGINDNDRETKGLYISDADGGNWQLLYEVDSVNTIEYYKDYIFIGHDERHRVFIK